MEDVFLDLALHSRHAPVLAGRMLYALEYAPPYRCGGRPDLVATGANLRVAAVEFVRQAIARFDYSVPCMICDEEYEIEHHYPADVWARVQRRRKFLADRKREEIACEDRKAMIWAKEMLRQRIAGQWEVGPKNAAVLSGGQVVQ